MPPVLGYGGSAAVPGLGPPGAGRDGSPVVGPHGSPAAGGLVPPGAGRDGSAVVEGRVAPAGGRWGPPVGGCGGSAAVGLGAAGGVGRGDGPAGRKKPVVKGRGVAVPAVPRPSVRRDAGLAWRGARRKSWGGAGRGTAGGRSSVDAGLAVSSDRGGCAGRLGGGGASGKRADAGGGGGDMASVCWACRVVKRGAGPAGAVSAEAGVPPSPAEPVSRVSGAGRRGGS